MTAKERAQIIFLSIILTVLLTMLYAYLIGAPIYEARFNLAQLFCAALHINCSL